MSQEDLILYDANSRIATITINRPGKANACNIAMLKKIHGNLVSADDNEKVKCVLIKSAGNKFFSAGYDLKEIQGSPENVHEVTKWGRAINETIVLMKKPVIIQVQGIAVGFGALLTLASDLRIFADRAKEDLYLQLPEIAISAFPQTGATFLPLMAFGLTHAKNLLYTTDKIGVEDLKKFDFPTRVFPYESLEEDTLVFIKQLTKYQTEFLFLIKTMLNIMHKKYIKACFDLEDECGKVAYDKDKKSMKELDNFIKNLYEEYA
jgi:enoyl-CoA hydratase/carnithine racemase